MKFDKIHNKGQATIFSNPLLEFFTKGHPLFIWAMYLPLSIYILYHGISNAMLTLQSAVMSFLAGMFFWTFFEYMMHRFVFHFIAESKRAMRFIYIIHGNHHEYPRDRERLFMPPLPSIILAAVVFSLMYFPASTAGLENYVLGFFPGFLVGYLLYGSMHYAIHAWKPPFRWTKSLWRNHHLHHYKSEEAGFGVSTTLWDRVFSTMFNSKGLDGKDAGERI